MPLKVTALWRYPVKSVGGEQLETATVSDLGIDGDRGWGVRDNTTGNILTGRRAPELLMATARLHDGEPIIQRADGTLVADDRELASWLGRDVSLVPATDDAGGTFENPMDPEHDRDWVSWTGPPGAFHDSGRARVSLLSAATARSWDLRRFRANVILGGGRDGDDDSLVGSAVLVGSCRLDVVKQIDRCVMVTRPQPGLERDLDVLRTINRERGSNLAIGAVIVEPGTISVGDAVAVARSEESSS